MNRYICQDLKLYYAEEFRRTFARFMNLFLKDLEEYYTYTYDFESTKTYLRVNAPKPKVDEMLAQLDMVSESH